MFRFHVYACMHVRMCVWCVRVSVRVGVRVRVRVRVCVRDAVIFSPVFVVLLPWLVYSRVSASATARQQGVRNCAHTNDNMGLTTRSRARPSGHT